MSRGTVHTHKELCIPWCVEVPGVDEDGRKTQKSQLT